jgi:hypothetical protein
MARVVQGLSLFSSPLFEIIEDDAGMTRELVHVLEDTAVEVEGKVVEFRIL